MAVLTEKDISVMIKYLMIGDDYDKAMRHFLSIAGGGGVVDQSDPLPSQMRGRIEEVYSLATRELNALFELDKDKLINSMRFFYIGQFDLVHGMLLSEGIHGATIYFPNLEKGAFAVVRQNDPEMHFVRITAFRQTGFEGQS